MQWSEPTSGAVSVERDGRVAVVEVDRGDGRNALSFQVMRDLIAVARGFEDDHETSAILLVPRGAFSVGFDLRDPETVELDDLGLAARRQRLRTGGRLCAAWEALDPVTIAVVDGWCVGGGVALAVSCDLRIAGADSMFYAPEIERGLNMSWGTLPRLVSLIGPARTKRLIIAAEKVDAARAEAWGLVDEVTAPGGAMDAALALARRIAAMPPVQVRMAKQTITACATMHDHAATHMSVDQFALSRASEDHREGVQAFLERRPPRFRGR